MKNPLISKPHLSKNRFVHSNTMSPPQISFNHSFFASEPASPTSSSFHQNMCFYSAPASPTRGTATTTTTATTTPKTGGDVYSNFDDFEFEISRRFNISDDLKQQNDSDSSQKSQFTMDDQQEGQRKRHVSVPSMAFADELFCDGKVMPLIPPPCQLYSNINTHNTSDNKFGKHSSSPTSPSNQISRFKIPFTRSLWNDDFDPFMVALETVKEGKKGGSHSHRRAFSMLPLRSCTQSDPDEFMSYEHEKCLHASPLILSPNKQMEPNGSATPTWTGSQQPAREGSTSPIKLAEPKGVLFARRARMVKMGYENKSNTLSPTPIEPMVQPGEDTRNKWHRILSFTLRSSSMSRSRTGNEHKRKDQNVDVSRPKILRKLSFRSKELVQGNKAKEVSQITKMTLVRYRPKLLLCMGYGAKYTK